MSITNQLKQHPRLKRMVLDLMIHPTLTRPRGWLRLLRPFYTHCAWSSYIYRSARMDVVPFHRFVLDHHSVVESFACINNAVGDVIVGAHTRIGLHNTVIGPVCIGDYVNLAQGVVLSGMNHGFDNPSQLISFQPVTKSPIVIENDVWIGANVTVTAGVHIGCHCVIGAGSVVTTNIPDYSVAVGVPARVVKNLEEVK